MTCVWIYEQGTDAIKVFSSGDEADAWFKVNDPEGIAFEFEVIGPDHIGDWIAYADKLEAALELAAGQSKDQLTKLHAEQGLRLVRPNGTDTGSVT